MLSIDLIDVITSKIFTNLITMHFGDLLVCFYAISFIDFHILNRKITLFIFKVYYKIRLDCYHGNALSSSRGQAEYLLFQLHKQNEQMAMSKSAIFLIDTCTSGYYRNDLI